MAERTDVPDKGPVPVRDVEQRRDDAVGGAGGERGEHYRHDEDDGKQRGNQTQRSTQPEPSEVDTSRAQPFLGQQACDEEPGQGEEHVHAEPSGLEAGHVDVVEHHRSGRHRSDAVERGSMSQPPRRFRHPSTIAHIALDL